MKFLQKLRFLRIFVLFAFGIGLTSTQLIPRPYFNQHQPYIHQQLPYAYQQQPYMDHQLPNMYRQEPESNPTTDPLQKELQEELDWVKSVMKKNSKIPPSEIWEPQSPDQVEAMMRKSQELPMQQNANQGVLQHTQPQNNQFLQSPLLSRAVPVPNPHAFADPQAIQQKKSPYLEIGHKLQNPEAKGSQPEEDTSLPIAEGEAATEQSETEAVESVIKEEKSLTETEEKQPETEETQTEETQPETEPSQPEEDDSQTIQQEEKETKQESISTTVEYKPLTETVEIKRINNLKKSFSKCGVKPKHAENQEKKEAEKDGKFTDRVQVDRKKREDGPLFRIVQGDVSVPDSWPWMAGMFRQKDNETEEFFCGSSLISTRFLLTAAHCFDDVVGDLKPEIYSVTLGHNRRWEGDTYDVEQVIIHPGYKKPMFYHDIVLIKVVEDVELSDSIFPVCLPSYNLKEIEYLPEKDFLTIAGWGITHEDDDTAAEFLKEVTVPVYNHTKCNELYNVMNENFPQGLTASFICAGLQEGGKDTCKGDSGGPLIVELEDKTWLQLGVLSSGYGCARSGYPGLYTKTAHYLDWIYYNTDLLGGIYEIRKDFVCSE